MIIMWAYSQHYASSRVDDLLGIIAAVVYICISIKKTPQWRVRNESCAFREEQACTSEIIIIIIFLI